ncbi:ribonucleoside-diphosphate reductase subunit alpha [Chromohalobacter canadensis]|uniref:ribonucleoside-diphosphate reductase subunit alpha n=1 Tax=Chromohalobacter canadensis TaxID=141389 RepID=UPI0021C0CF06|nr:ribonucleoside-diphosphate reductase subunit alpha [Chromohalobacter canadensis]MCT8467167.1 ribonucleoside-diphosphate reductase subunit alpha [Chromohalobacter canadensis]MCT8471085.1 ribonucleoside-diphosphate reductase subunit alpha [Chromohalobacter canadensis]MCT8497664.1 ribonucleoside-diphosphate reductase subunit alpha [Chromohalobacter canadensis]
MDTTLSSPDTTSVDVTAPQRLRVIKRNGDVAPFDGSKVSVAITKAFIATEGDNAAASSRIRDFVQEATQSIVDTFLRRMPDGGTLHIEDIQDQVELALMRAGEQKVARAYVLYREEHARARQPQGADIAKPHPSLNVTQADGTVRPLDLGRVETLVADACEGLTNVEPQKIVDASLKNLYDGVSIDGVSQALTMTARTLVEKEPNYTYATARLLQDNLRREALSFLDIADEATYQEMADLYAPAFKAYIAKGIAFDQLDSQLAEFDLERLGAALDHTRDAQFTYLGLQTLYDRYFLHHDDIRYELPQVMFMRVAMGLALNEDDREARAIEFYELLSSFDYMASTPTLFNAGTIKSQLSSCYLTTVPDQLDGIYSAIRDNAMLSKWAGGLGNDWTPVRALGSYIKGTNGKSQGVVPFLKVVNDTAVAVNQGGKRKGAVCAYLETWHLDVEEFLELRKNTGDDRRRTHDMNTANWVPDLFMKRVFDDEEWTLFSPSTCPDLHDLYGAAFEKRYAEYEEMTRNGQLKLFKRVKAKDLWRKMLSMLFETGHPWITFKDPCNLRSPQNHAGVVHSSNLCTEITLNTSADEIAVCNLGSINLAQHIVNGELDGEKLKKTVKTAVRMLDNVIDINYYAVPQAKNSNIKHRPVGLGLMGFQDALYKRGIAYASEEAVAFSDTSMELISYHAIEASSDLAAERGRYQSFEGSLWSKGVLPIDSIANLAEERGADYIEVDTSTTQDWARLRDKVTSQGMRNSNVMAIAPTATISNICGVTQSIEPTYQNLFVKSNLSGEFTVVNAYMVNDLKERGLWDEVMINDLKYYDGSVQPIDRVPDDLKARYASAFEVEPKWLVEAAARRQKWIDQAQSLNLYIAGVSGKKLDVTYRMAWFRGLKTTYYLRALGATSVEKSTVDRGNLNAVGNADSGAAPSTQPAASSAPSPAASGTSSEARGIDDFLNGKSGSGSRAPSAGDIDELGCEACQ